MNLQELRKIAEAAEPNQLLMLSPETVLKLLDLVDSLLFTLDELLTQEQGE